MHGGFHCWTSSVSFHLVIILSRAGRFIILHFSVRALASNGCWEVQIFPVVTIDSMTSIRPTLKLAVSASLMSPGSGSSKPILIGPTSLFRHHGPQLLQRSHDQTPRHRGRFRIPILLRSSLGILPGLQAAVRSTRFQTEGCKFVKTHCIQRFHYQRIKTILLHVLTITRVSEQLSR